jgi:hypothetical protein
VNTLRICTAAILVTALACAGGSSPSATPSPSGSSSTTAAAPRDPDLITADELASPAVSTGNALDAVRRLRPNFLIVRGMTSMKNASAGGVHVSVDGGALQTVDVLSSLRASEVAEIRYLNPSSAAQRFGTNTGSGGVILVKSK